jgi:hypothetical protein
MYVGYTETFSVRFFVLLNSYVFRWNKIFGMWIFLLTCADNRNGNKTSTFMDGGPSNYRWGPNLTACLVGLQSHSWLHRGRCLTRTGPKYVGSLVCTESLRMNVGYTNSFSICFFVNTYDTVHIVFIKIHIVFTMAYNTYWACGGFFFSEIRNLRMERYTFFWGRNAPFPPQKITCLSSEAHIGLFVQNFNFNVV